MPDPTARVRGCLFRAIEDLARLHDRDCNWSGREEEEMLVQIERAKAAWEAERAYRAREDELAWSERLDARRSMTELAIPIRELAEIVERLARHLRR